MDPHASTVKRYDAVIIGAGPCGMFSALELMGSHDVAIIDAGVPLQSKVCSLESAAESCAYCKPVCNILGGFGGAQFFEGTKLSRYPAGTGLLNFVDGLPSLELLYDEVDAVLESYGKAPRPESPAATIERLATVFSGQGVDLKYYNAQKVSKSTMNGIAYGIADTLVKGGVDIRMRERLLDLEGQNSDFRLTTDYGIVECGKVIIAAGRIGSRQLLGIAQKAGLVYDVDDHRIEIGVRVEAPHEVFKDVDGVHNDLKLKRSLPDGEELRTFCQDHKGFITKCVYNLRGDRVVSSLDGHIIGTDEEGGRMSEVTNLAVHHRFTNGHKDIYDHIRKMSKNGKPLVQTMKSFMSGTLDDAVFGRPLSLPEVELANINEYLPERTLSHLKDFILRIDAVLPGFAAESNAVYAPSFEMGWKKFILDSAFESTVKGVYIGGDITGHFRGAMQAMASGILIARNIKKERGALVDAKRRPAAPVV